MVLLALFVLSGLLAYQGMQVGLYPVLSRVVMGALSVAAAVGFAGPLCLQIPSDNAYLFGTCMLAIAVAAYLLQRGVADYLIPQRDVSLPTAVDRVGGAVSGFAGGVMALGFFCLVALAVPLPDWAAGVEPQLRPAAQIAVKTTRLVGACAGGGSPITLERVLPFTPPPATQSAPSGDGEPERSAPAPAPG